MENISDWQRAGGCRIVGKVIDKFAASVELESVAANLHHSAGAGFRQGGGDWRRAYPKVRSSRSPPILAEKCPAP